jgi:hypothetical protein
MVAAVLEQVLASHPGLDRTASAKEGKVQNAMTLPFQEQERIREEELFRAQLRKNIKREKRPRLIALTMLWAIALILLAYFAPHLRI